jgi:cytochrome c oxidase cbb3-type subunit III
MSKYIPAYIRVPFIFILVMGFIEYFVDSGDTFAFVKYPMILLFLIVALLVLIAIEIMMKATDNILYHIMSPEEKKKVDEANAIPLTETEWYKNLKVRLTKTQPLENEPQLLLHHDYDGIKELDNVLPPWWVYLFYGCILFSAIYLVRYHILGAPNQEMELKNEMAQAKIEVAEYMKTAPDLMDEKTVTQLTDKEALSAGKTIFTTSCVACHRADGGGAIGPNLTDDHWILGGGIKNIFHTINNGGRDGKGMISWKATLKPKEMQKVASYIMSLKDSNPKDPKAPEGDLWVDANAVTKDSTIIKK